MGSLCMGDWVEFGIGGFGIWGDCGLVRKTLKE